MKNNRKNPSLPTELAASPPSWRGFSLGLTAAMGTSRSCGSSGAAGLSRDGSGDSAAQPLPQQKAFSFSSFRCPGLLAPADWRDKPSDDGFSVTAPSLVNLCLKPL